MPYLVLCIKFHELTERIYCPDETGHFSSFPNILTLPLSWDAVGLWDRLPHEPRKPIQAKGPGGQVAGL